MRTLAGPTSSVLIIEVSLIQGLDLFIITMSSILYNDGKCVLCTIQIQHNYVHFNLVTALSSSSVLVASSA